MAVLRTIPLGGLTLYECNAVPIHSAAAGDLAINKAGAVDAFLYECTGGTTWTANTTGGGGGGAPTTVDYLVRTADAGLSAERVVTDTASLVWDWATGGQAKGNVQFGATGTTACVGNDGRLSDSRTPLAHVLATNVALGALETISGATAGQVLRASAATAANFQTLVAADIPTLEPTVLRVKTTANQAAAIGVAATAVTSLTLTLAATTRYRFVAWIPYVCTVTAATLAARATYSGTLSATGTGQSMYRALGSSGVPTVWAAAYRENTQAINAAIATATGGPGAVGSAAVAILVVEGFIWTNAGGSLGIEIVGSAALSITPQAGCVLEAWIVP